MAQRGEIIIVVFLIVGKVIASRHGHGCHRDGHAPSHAEQKREQETAQASPVRVALQLKPSPREVR
jgi:hypothetical protein